MIVRDELEDNVYQLTGTHDDEDFICRGCLAEGIIADALERAGCTPEDAEELSEVALDALFAADLL